MRSRSKVSIVLFILLALFCAVPTAGGIMFFTSGDKMMLFVLIVGALDILLLAPTLFLTHYTLTDKALQVRCSFLFRADIPYRCIRRVSDSRDISLAPALSSDRIEIAYRISGGDGKVLISPKDKDAFAKELCRRAETRFETLGEAWERKRRETLAAQSDDARSAKK